ncbi:hypothetical protein WA026_016435 [Henosepilachna vigintioctopunctata]|uniref:Vacuolar fusion protein CCZ1 homolog n=1 Tax=Henosepilachna vigintioctopunctata TaxID=420089 RepID=A0AAW1UFT9_9CUCU
MGDETTTSLRNFFIFNPTLGTKEGEELKKILYYHPVTDHVDVQIKNVGLVEGIINFTGTFGVSSDITSLHTQKTRQIFLEAEKNFWMVMILNVPMTTKVKDGVSSPEYLEGAIQDKVYQSVLRQAYFIYRLFWNTFQNTTNKDGVDALKTRLEIFYSAYLKSLKLAHADILNIFSGIQYLPLDKLTFLKVQCLINGLECDYPQVTHTAFLYNDHLIWSSVEPSDMQVLYHYLISTLLPANLEVELQGGSMQRHSTSPFSALRHGRFVTGPSNLKNAKTTGKVPRIYTFSGPTASCYHLIVYRVLSASLCLFVKAEKELDIDFFRKFDSYISPKLTSLVSDIAEYCSKQVSSPSNVPENAPKFIYFNKFNLAYKSTVHLDNKQSGNVTISDEQLKIIADLNTNGSSIEDSTETVVKTLNDYWVVAKTSNYREFYIVEQQRNAHLIDISKDIKTICETELKGIFFQPI